MNLVVSECLDCRAHWRDPMEEDMIMCLHAFSYQSKEWQYQTPNLPTWAQAFTVDAGAKALTLGPSLFGPGV